jgi:hypothetical protein
MSNNSSNDGSFWFWLILIGSVMVLGQIAGNGNKNSSPPASSSSSPNTPAQAYVEQRFRNEGYSNAESKQAAEAVMKFHEAQKNRR